MGMAGLTNRDPVRDSWLGTPWLQASLMTQFIFTVRRFLFYQYITQIALYHSLTLKIAFKTRFDHQGALNDLDEANFPWTKQQAFAQTGKAESISLYVTH